MRNSQNEISPFTCKRSKLCSSRSNFVWFLPTNLRRHLNSAPRHRASTKQIRQPSKPPSLSHQKRIRRWTKSCCRASRWKSKLDFPQKLRRERFWWNFPWCSNISACWGLWSLRAWWWEAAIRPLWRLRCSEKRRRVLEESKRFRVPQSGIKWRRFWCLGCLDHSRPWLWLERSRFRFEDCKRKRLNWRLRMDFPLGRSCTRFREIRLRSHRDKVEWGWRPARSIRSGKAWKF